MIVFEEIPDKVTLAVNITNCQNRCVGCHSPELREDIGNELTKEEIDKMIEGNYGVNCFLFMGEGNDIVALTELSRHVREKHKIDTALYSGKQKIEQYMVDNFDYVKIGPYIEEYGPLNKETTNQRLYKVASDKSLIDITSRFRK
jgi:anaerobic ribonucleoside-triphosphate reductase activating protein